MLARIQILFVAALAACGLCFSDGNAANSTKKSPAAKSNASPVSLAKSTTASKAGTTAKTQPHHEAYAMVLKELQQAEHKLHAALHDYQGHRAKAAAEIKKAIHEIEQHHAAHHKSTGVAPKAGTQAKTSKPVQKAANQQQGPITAEQQKASDLQLRQAEKHVHAALHQLHQVQTQGGEAHPHAAKAEHFLKEASHEIQSALHTLHNQKQAAVANN